MVKSRKFWLLPPILGLLLGLSFIATHPPKPKILTAEMSAQGTAGRVVTGQVSSTASRRLSTASQALYESPQITPIKPRSNAAVLTWDQAGDSGKVTPSFRVFDGQKWSAWIESASDNEDRKDGTPASHSALILTTKIQKIQYRFQLTATNGKSPEVNLESPRLQLIDSTQGPSPTKKGLVSGVLEKLGLAPAASAHADGPHIITRAEWGCPEPDSSDGWTLEYRPLDRAIVHHTVTAFSPDSAATIRAIWQFHTFTRGWGDIGYNYVVDPSGNIFQGRYFDHNYADTHRVDIVAGHAYGWNYGTTGIAALGDFTSVRPSETMLKAIGDITAFKLHRYDRDPTGWYDGWPVVMGHKDVGTTSCPGSAHLDLPSIRTFASRQIWHYRLVDHWDSQPRGQGIEGSPGTIVSLVAGETTKAYFDFRNTGIEDWRATGQAPVRLGADRPRDRASGFADSTWINVTRPTSLKYRVDSYNSDGTGNLTPATVVQPGETARFEFNLKAPEAPGNYLEQFQLVTDNVAWFIRDFNVSFRILVAPRQLTWRGLEQTIYTDSTKTRRCRSDPVRRWPLARWRGGRSH